MLKLPIEIAVGTWGFKMISRDAPSQFLQMSRKRWTVIFDGDEKIKVWWSNVQKGCPVPPRESSPILTSVAFFSASSSFSWASLRASENLSSSSSVPFNFFCRATKSSSSWGAFRCAGSFRGGQRERAQAHRSDRGRERRRGREVEIGRKGERRQWRAQGRKEERGEKVRGARARLSRIPWWRPPRRSAASLQPFGTPQSLYLSRLQ